MNENFNYNFNLTGNAASTVPQITAGVTAMTGKIKESCGAWDSLQGKIVVLNQLSDFVGKFQKTVEDTFKPGADLNKSLSELAAISGSAGKELQMIEKYARESALTFGGSAAQSVESYKLLLSQLSPELTKYPAALKAMGDNVSILSKTMGGDATAAAGVLTTAMNQYGVSLDDPIKASEIMAEMMNVMAAAGQAGSAELPTIKQALEQCGMAAKAAGVSFVETNAAIQVLDKAGKKGSEGGIALRNVMATLEKGRFLPKDVQKELQAAGVDINTLTDKSRSLTERLRVLEPVMNDSALFSKLFGQANANAARALVQGVDQVDKYTEAIEGTNTAMLQAETIMESYNEKKARVQAQFDDLKISIFHATGDFGIWVETIAGSLVPLAQLTPLIMGVGSAINWVIDLDYAGMWRSITGAITGAYTRLGFFNGYLAMGQVQALGFRGNVLQATIALLRFVTVGLWSALKALGAYLLSLVTCGDASVKFAAISSASFATFKTAAVTACRAVSIAIKSIPVIGWVITAIAAIGGLFVYFWNTSVKFRAVMKGLGAAFVATFKEMWEVAKTVFSAIGKLIIAALKFDGQGIKDAIGSMTDRFRDAGQAAGKAFTDAYNAEIARGNPSAPEIDTPEFMGQLTAGSGLDENPIVSALGSIGGLADKADKIKNINIAIDQVVGRFEIHTTNLHEDVSRVKEMVAEALLSAVNDANYAR